MATSQDICHSLGLPKTVNTIRKKRETFERQYESFEVCGDAKRSRMSHNKDVDAALLDGSSRREVETFQSTGRFCWP